VGLAIAAAACLQGCTAAPPAREFRVVPNNSCCLAAGLLERYYADRLAGFSAASGLWARTQDEEVPRCHLFADISCPSHTAAMWLPSRLSLPEHVDDAMWHSPSGVHASVEVQRGEHDGWSFGHAGGGRGGCRG
jgi:hypothetical protein